MTAPTRRDQREPLFDAETKLLIRFQVRAVLIAVAFTGTLIAFVGVTVLDEMTDTAAELAGVAIAGAGIVLGYAVSGYYLIKETE